MDKLKCFVSGSIEEFSNNSKAEEKSEKMRRSGLPASSTPQHVFGADQWYFLNSQWLFRIAPFGLSDGSNGQMLTGLTVHSVFLTGC